MKVIYANLHTNGFYVRSINKMITKRRTIPKHRHYLDALKDNGIEICNLVTRGGTTLPFKFIRKITRFYPFRIAEARYVLKKSNLEYVKNITSPNEIGEKDIVIYYSTFDSSQFENVLDVNGIKIVDHVHFYGDSKTANLIKDSGFAYYMYEVNLNKYSPLYRKNYSWFSGEYIERPYYYEERFKRKKLFSDRLTMAVAMGTHTVCNLEEYIEEYGTNSYQPHRKMILDHACEYPDELKSYISDYDDETIAILPSDFVLTKFRKKIHNFFSLGQQKSYFSFDMVETYNNYKMFICPEDVNGSYGVGTFEGMACGCAMIGINSGIFEDMGMKAGRDYISYDGSLEDLISKIRYYQRPENQTILESIANNGCNFVQSHFSRELVGMEYVKHLKNLVQDGN